MQARFIKFISDKTTIGLNIDHIEGYVGNETITRIFTKDVVVEIKYPVTSFEHYISGPESSFITDIIFRKDITLKYRLR